MHQASQARAGRVRAAIFDVYGTLIVHGGGGFQPSAAADQRITSFLHARHKDAPPEPSVRLARALAACRSRSHEGYPEVNMVSLLGCEFELHEQAAFALWHELESVNHPLEAMPGCRCALAELKANGLIMGLLSNAQANTPIVLSELFGSNMFERDLSIFSYEWGLAKPSRQLFEAIVTRLKQRGIAPQEACLIGNDPLADIVPAACIGMRTALFTGHPLSLRPGHCKADLSFEDWSQLVAWLLAK